jgi:hypothetical protein
MGIRVRGLGAKVLKSTPNIVTPTISKVSLVIHSDTDIYRGIYGLGDMG